MDTKPKSLADFEQEADSILNEFDEDHPLSIAAAQYQETMDKVAEMMYDAESEFCDVLAEYGIPGDSDG